MQHLWLRLLTVLADTDNRSHRAANLTTAPWCGRSLQDLQLRVEVVSLGHDLLVDLQQSAAKKNRNNKHFVYQNIIIETYLSGKIETQTECD